MRAKYLAKSRKRKREMQENAVDVPSAPALTNAECMKRYRLRKKLAKATSCVNDTNAGEAQCADTEPVAESIPGRRNLVEPTDANPESIADATLEPMPGRSIDPVMFRNVLRHTESFHGKFSNNIKCDERCDDSKAVNVQNIDE